MKKLLRCCSAQAILETELINGKVAFKYTDRCTYAVPVMKWLQGRMVNEGYFRHFRFAADIRARGNAGVAFVITIVF